MPDLDSMRVRTTVPHNPMEGERPEVNISLHDGSDEKISIIVVHKDRPEYLNILLQSITVCSMNSNYEVIVVDNGSTGQDSIDYLKEIEGEVKVVRNEKNLYWSEACNRGVQAADKSSKYLVFLHHDVAILNPNWLDLLINVAEAHKSGLVGVELQAYLVQNQKAEFVQEWLMLMTRECFDAIGPWPTAVPQVGPAFIMTIRAQHKGFKPQKLTNSVAHHYRIFALDINEYERMLEGAMVTIPQLLRDVQSTPVPVSV